MRTLDEIREFFRGDLFATDQGMVIDEVDGDRAVCSVLLRDGHKNGVGNIQGGLIFTLADFAFAVAVNNQACNTVTLDSSIHYFRPPTGNRLIAEAVCNHRSRSICVYTIRITDENHTPIAMVTSTGYTRA